MAKLNGAIPAKTSARSTNRERFLALSRRSRRRREVRQSADFVEKVSA
jgi:hypothetical protein